MKQRFQAALAPYGADSADVLLVLSSAWTIPGSLPHCAQAPSATGESQGPGGNAHTQIFELPKLLSSYPKE